MEGGLDGLGYLESVGEVGVGVEARLAAEEGGEAVAVAAGHHRRDRSALWFGKDGLEWTPSSVFQFSEIIIMMSLIFFSSFEFLLSHQVIICELGQIGFCFFMDISSYKNIIIYINK